MTVAMKINYKRKRNKGTLVFADGATFLLKRTEALTATTVNLEGSFTEQLCNGGGQSVKFVQLCMRYSIK